MAAARGNVRSGLKLERPRSSTRLPGSTTRAYAVPMGLWDALRALWAFFVLIGHFFLWLFNLGR